MGATKERLSQKTTPKFWKTVRNIAAVIALIGGGILSAGATLPATVITITTIVTSVAGGVAGTAAMTKDTD